MGKCDEFCSNFLQWVDDLAVQAVNVQYYELVASIDAPHTHGSWGKQTDPVKFSHFNG